MVSNFHNGKNYEKMTKEDILAFLNKLRKSQMKTQLTNGLEASMADI